MKEGTQKQTFKVKITGCSSSHYWYASSIGNTFEVNKYTESSYLTVEKVCVGGGLANAHGLIGVEDCEIVPPSLSKEEAIEAFESSKGEQSLKFADLKGTKTAIRCLTEREYVEVVALCGIEKDSEWTYRKDHTAFSLMTHKTDWYLYFEDRQRYDIILASDFITVNTANQPTQVFDAVEAERNAAPPVSGGAMEIADRCLRNVNKEIPRPYEFSPKEYTVKLFPFQNALASDIDQYAREVAAKEVSTAIAIEREFMEWTHTTDWMYDSEAKRFFDKDAKGEYIFATTSELFDIYIKLKEKDHDIY